MDAVSWAVYLLTLFLKIVLWYFGIGLVLTLVLVALDGDLMMFLSSLRYYSGWLDLWDGSWAWGVWLILVIYLFMPYPVRHKLKPAS